MIFDEIDTGISGITASVVGRKMSQLGQRHQILCITHLPQIAAAGDHQYQIAKDEDGDSSYTTIRRLSGEERTTEIARLLGGANITGITLASAGNCWRVPVIPSKSSEYLRNRKRINKKYFPERVAFPGKYFFIVIAKRSCYKTLPSDFPRFIFLYSFGKNCDNLYPLEDLCNRLLYRQPFRVDGDIRISLIQRNPVIIQIRQRLPRTHSNAPGLDIFQTAVDLRKR